MIYARFVVPDGGGGRRPWPFTTASGRRARGGFLSAGAVMNDHHGVGLKLAPYMERQHGKSLDTLRRLKAALDPNGIMNPGKLGL